MHSVFVADSRFSPEAVLKYPNMSLINKIDRWYAGARYGKAGKLSLETEIELICANLKIICKTSGNQAES